MNQSRYHYRRHRQKKEFLFPFIIIICLGIIIALVFQIVLAFKNDNSLDLNRRVMLYFEGDNLEILPTEQSSWINAYSGTVVFEGDSVRTGEDTRAVLYFNDGNVLRLDQNSQLILSVIDHSAKTGIQADMDLSYGQIWMNKVSFDGDYILRTQNSKIYSIGTIFSFENRSSEILRVLDGSVQFDVREEIKDGKYAVIDSYIVRVGQELNLTEDNLQAIKDRKVIDLIAAVSNEWEDSPWYVWNREEDANPTDYSGVEIIGEGRVVEDKTEELEAEELVPEEVQEGDEIADEIKDEVKTEEPEIEKEEEEKVEDLKQTPVVSVSKPASTPFTYKGNSYLIEGKVSGYAQSVVVEALTGDGAKDVYTLQKFKPGDSSWSYTAAYAFANLSEGTNRYTVYAKDANGKSSAQIVIEIVVPVGTLKPKEEEAEVIEPVEEPTEEVTDTSDNSNLNLSIQLTSFNGEANNGNRYETSEESVKVVGSVSSEVVKVLISGFELTLFVPGSGVFQYFAKPEFGTLNAGENSFTAYGLDKDGNRTNELKFVIVKN